MDSYCHIMFMGFFQALPRYSKSSISKLSVLLGILKTLPLTISELVLIDCILTVYLVLHIFSQEAKMN